jgi:hypothetical protein
MHTLHYKVYPSLLNSFARYLEGKKNKQELIDQINRVPLPTTPAQNRGASFESAVIKGIHEDEFDHRILEQVRSLLPRPMLNTQVYCEYVLNDVLIYGFVDVIGKTLAVDIKTTGKYHENYFISNHQNFYLPALKSKGIQTLRYVITDFRSVFQEEYDRFSDFSVQESQVQLFVQFLEEHRNLITDSRIFVSE